MNGRFRPGDGGTIACMQHNAGTPDGPCLLGDGVHAPIPAFPGTVAVPGVVGISGRGRRGPWGLGSAR
eukprot:2079572-Lingulodinium_polyedra.AAC.1